MRWDYVKSQEIAHYSFCTLLCALIRAADTTNLEKLTSLWPEEVAEFRARYTAQGGWLESDEVSDD